MVERGKRNLTTELYLGEGSRDWAVGIEIFGKLLYGTQERARYKERPLSNASGA
jgi:hypothetical protein